MTKKEDLLAEYSGVIASFQQTEINCHTYGYRDRSNRLPNIATTKFGLASAGKGFVAVGILLLIAEGKLTLNQSIEEILSEYDLGKTDTTTTVYELLTHTSSIQDYFDEEIMTDYADLWKTIPNYSIRTNKDIFPLFVNKPVKHEHRGQFRYNNSGFVVLAEIIESLTGQTFDSYLKEAVFLPFGMHDTGYYELDCLPENTANAYYKAADGQWRMNIYSIDAKGTGAGGAFSTAEDIARFWRGLYTHQILPSDYTNELFKPHVNAEDRHYGLGFWLKPAKNATEPLVPYLEGCDPGTTFYSCCNGETGSIFISNNESNVWQLAAEWDA